MSPSWPQRIDGGQGRVGYRDAQKTGFPKLKIRSRFWPGTETMLKLLSLVLGLALQTSATRRGRPRILYIFREFWKPGHEAALNRIEAEAARVCIGFGVPHPYLGIESLTGSKEVWYINGFASTEELAQVTEIYSKKQELQAAMNRFAQQRSEFKSQPDSQGTAVYRAELSRGPKWEMGQERFLVIAVTKGNPHSDGTVFESPNGVRFVVTPAKTRTEADAKLSAAGPDAKMFAVRPEFSMPAAEWVAGDPWFWNLKAHKK
jgi:hypothetical protein